MIKQITTIALLVAFTMQTFNSVVIILHYYTNRDVYAKNCINKSRPELHCNGKCQLMKKLKQEEKKDQENPERKADNKNEITLFSKSFFTSVAILPVGSGTVIKFSPHSESKPVDRSFGIFHPPQS